MTDAVIEKLKEMGFNTYEAKVYLALLQHHPATGYEISKESGVPQARAYDTLKALEGREIVISMGGKPTTYVPVAPEELIARWERSFKGSVKFLKESLPSLGNESVEPVINLRGETSIDKHALEMMEQAEKSIFLELWSEDVPKFQDALQAAKARGVDIKIVGYNNLELPGIDVYQHGLARTIEESLGGRWIILAVDGKAGMVGTVPPEHDRAPQGVLTRNPGIVLIIKELIVHDIFLLDVENNLAEECERVYGKNLMALRRKILGDETAVAAH